MNCTHCGLWLEKGQYHERGDCNRDINMEQDRDRLQLALYYMIDQRNAWRDSFERMKAKEVLPVVADGKVLLAFEEFKNELDDKYELLVKCDASREARGLEICIKALGRRIDKIKKE